MMTGAIADVVKQIRRRVAVHEDSPSDRTLLDRFIRGAGDDTFDLLVERHASLVFGVCRRMLRDHHDAEDAFQATFLVLARKAASIRSEVLCNWLYGVAYRVSMEARKMKQRQRALESALRQQAKPAPESASPSTDAKEILDDELTQIPEKYRSAILLCDLQGLSRKQAAAKLSIPEGTLSSRLAVARKMLADRLARRGLAIPMAGLAAVLSQEASAAVATTLTGATAKVVGLFLAGKGTAGGLISTNAIALFEAIITQSALAKLKASIAVVLIVVIGVGTLMAGLSSRAEPVMPPVPPAAVEVVANAPPKDAPLAQAVIEPPPPGALARMGTLGIRHTDTINFVAFPPDGTTVLTAGEDNTVRLWNRQTGKEIQRIDGPRPPQSFRPVGPGPSRDPIPQHGLSRRGFSQVAMSHDGKLVAIAEHGAHLQICSLETGKQVRKFKTPTNVVAVHFSPDGKMVAIRDNGRSTYLFDADTGVQLHQLKPEPQGETIGIVLGGRGGAISGCAFSQDGKFIVTSEVKFHTTYVTMFVKFSDTKTGKEIRRFDTECDTASAIACSPDGKLVAVGIQDAISLRDADTGKEIRTTTYILGAADLVFSPDSKLLAVKGNDKVVRLIDASTGKVTYEFGEPVTVTPNMARIAFFNPGEVRDLAFSNDGKLLSVGGAMSLRTWNTATGNEQSLVGGHRNPISASVVAPDGKTLITRSFDNTIRRWSIATSTELGAFNEPLGTTDAVFSPDGKLAALANDDGSVRLFAVDSGKELHKLKGHTTGVIANGRGVAALAFSPDGKLLASRGGADSAIRFYDSVTGAEHHKIVLHGGNVPGGAAFIVKGGGNFTAGSLAIAFAPDSLTLAAVLPATQVHKFKGAPDIGNPTTTVRILDIASGKELRVIHLPAGRYLHGIAYAPDGRLIAAENTDQTISLLEVISGRERALLGKPNTTAEAAAPLRPLTLARVPLAPASLAFSPDGAVLAMRGGNDVRFFDVDARAELDSLKGHAAPVTSLAFGSNGKTLATGSADTTAIVWDLSRVKPAPRPALIELNAKALEALWIDLLGDDAKLAGQGIRVLSSAPKHAVPFLRERVKAVPPLDQPVIDGWLLDLDSPNFAKRTRATAELERLGALAIPGLQKLLAGKPSVEARRRVETLRDKLVTGIVSAEEIRIVRAIEVLERTQSADARALLVSLSRGAPGALTTNNAQAALRRLP